MKYRIKSFWALLLIACMIFMVTPSRVEAAVSTKAGTRIGNAKTLKWSTKKTFAIKLNKSRTDYWVRFKTCADRRFYNIVIKNCTKSWSVRWEITDKFNERLCNKNDRDGDGYIYSDCCNEYNIKLQKSRYYYIHIINEHKESGYVKVRVESRRDLEGDSIKAAKAIKVGKTAVGKVDGTDYNDTDYFKFKPSSNGKYIVKIKNIDCGYWYYPKFSIMDQYKDIMVSDKDIEPDCEEEFPVKLKSGKWYYIRCSGTDTLGNYKVTVKKK